ncbi:tyrosine-type recombinase/integrase [Antarcticibacterium sp. 1MA-6-2]|uniref:tyrosine-type recombinase/integrase n=1 Tax=Antarcticibacterium sp. 1MA-6-2 TaxID=2908210 RepID=UPI001F32DA04|nr:tyrosine-type recombinase/integrase [Antarcticibacterium sp. 1MA-6-2]UJH90932.1 tyrosine-type recombinase/integrase [Antarcticibacterium sp. 1MA-6-2]
MTGSTYINFDKAQGKGMKLIRTGENPVFGLLIITGVNLGLRISDLLSLTFNQLRSGTISITEGKTGKKRNLKVNENIRAALEYFKEENGEFYAFRSRKGTVYSIQQVNRVIKKYFKGTDITSHSLRKSFGRRVWDNHQQSEKALVYLSELFNHTSVSVTRKYLGIRQTELDDIYMSL